jgi:hypothetical protein
MTTNTTPKLEEFDLEAWRFEEGNLDESIERNRGIFQGRKEGYRKAQEQFEGERQRVWDAARDTIECTPREWDALFRNLKWDCLEHFDAAQKEQTKPTGGRDDF